MDLNITLSEINEKIQALEKEIEDKKAELKKLRDIKKVIDK